MTDQQAKTLSMICYFEKSQEDLLEVYRFKENKTNLIIGILLIKTLQNMRFDTSNELKENKFVDYFEIDEDFNLRAKYGYLTNMAQEYSFLHNCNLVQIINNNEL